MTAPKWHALWVDGKYNPRVVAQAKVASGAYAIRRKDTHEVLYVGESSRGTIWKTLLRHFQAPLSFAAQRETGVLRGSPAEYDVALHVTSRGHRPRPPSPTKPQKSKRLRTLERRGVPHRTDADQRAMASQARWIARLKPAQNKDDGMSAAAADEYRAHRAQQEAEDRGRNLLEFNPAPEGALTELGKLTRLEPTRGKILRWSLRQAPSLAYDDAGRLFIVYTGKIVRSSTPAEIREYGRTHWGQTATGKVRAGGVAPLPFVRLATAKSITYTTKKGADAELVDYVHPFGEGASSRGFLPPQIVEHECLGGCGPRCAARGALALHGGSYRVTSRGIVG